MLYNCFLQQIARSKLFLAKYSGNGMKAFVSFAGQSQLIMVEKHQICGRKYICILYEIFANCMMYSIQVWL